LTGVPSGKPDAIIKGDGMALAQRKDLHQPASMGGWLTTCWLFACLMSLWHLTSIIGDGSAMMMMFGSSANVASMQVVLWLKIWTWMPLLILAPLGARWLRGAVVAAMVAGALLEIFATVFLLDIGLTKVWAIIIFDVVTVVLIGAYLLRSRRVAAICAASSNDDRRIRVHALLLLLVGGSLSVAIFAASNDPVVDRVSILSAYQFSVLLAAVLLIGPIFAMGSGRASINIHLRRDLAIWAGITGLLHLYAGIGESMSPGYIATFVAPPVANANLERLNELFTWGTISGLVIGVLVLLLLGLSSDRVLRRLGTRWWKRLQRCSYAVFILTLAHALMFQYLESRSEWWVIFTIGLALVVLLAQIAGGWSVHRQRSVIRRL
jgi:sulfoxide reductase heme-binding subunit YedZ